MFLQHSSPLAHRYGFFALLGILYLLLIGLTLPFPVPPQGSNSHFGKGLKGGFGTRPYAVNLIKNYQCIINRTRDIDS
ncbi:MAG: hypothetical protein DM484_23420 [Candidatus Methylumidiphilus alinenensis]|uniref:Uncharacterized protein n=1 Tax=Candidatus Methylumidiphilus alinenensis TaxID=2202197 RepID=A0A2W4SJG4_9GAMM|nr:MAG: hypothetical protein DM484_23420 [Candidatus Methylumidiphilus alinenensis]